MTKEELEKENAELKAQISVLLSCKNCPENKGGYICEKEYNDKCLAQKIQYIKELKKELEAQIEKMKCCENCQTVRDADGNCYLLKDGKCKNKDKWEMKQ
jgi:hypothetical protein